MKKQAGGPKTAWIVLAAALLVIVFVLAAFLMARKGSNRDAITLPDGVPQDTTAPAAQQPDQAMVTVSRDNVLKLLSTLERPEAYHQTVALSAALADGAAQGEAEIWRSGDLVRASVRRDGGEEDYLTDGKTVYLWYAGENRVRKLAPDTSVKLDDLIGVPSYEDLRDLTADRILEAGYLTLDEGEGVNCLYVSASADDDGYSSRYWIDVDHQLLYRAYTLSGGEQIYSMQQTALELLTTEDGDLKQRFALPDGSSPFATS